MKLGSLDINAVKLGSQNVDKIYVGSTQVWPTYTPPAYVSAGIQLYYNPDDPSSYSGTGTTVNDLSGNNYNGTLQNGVTYSTNSFLLDGFNDYITTPNMVSSFNNTSAFTIEVWYNPTWTSNNEGGTVVQENGDGIPSNTWHYSVIEHERAPFGSLAYDYAGIWTTSGLVPVNPNGTTNGWRQVVITYDSGTATSYLNAQIPKTVNVTRLTPWSQGSNYYLMLGAGDSTNQSGSGGFNFKGNIGIFRAYNRALSSTEVQSNFNNAKSIYGL